MKVHNLPVSPPHLHVLADSMSRRFLLSYAIDRITLWIVTVAAIALTYRLTGSMSAVALLVLIQVVSKFAFAALADRVDRPRSTWILPAVIARIFAAGGLLLVSERADLWWAFVLAGVFAGANGLVEGVYATLLPDVGSRRFVPVLNRLVGRVEQASALLGPVFAGLILLMTQDRVAFGFAALALLATPVLLWGYRPAPVNDALSPFVPLLDDTVSAWDRIRSHDALRMVLVGLLAVAALGVLIRVALIGVVVDSLEYATGVYGLLLGLIGVGALVGPVPVDKLLGHFRVEIIMAAGVVALTVGAMVIGLGGPVLLVAPALLASGLLIVTLDLVAAVTLRRVVADSAFASVNQMTVRAVLTGQVSGLIILLTTSYVWNPTVATVSLCGLCTGVTLLLFLVSGGPQAMLSVVSRSRGDADRQRSYSG